MWRVPCGGWCPAGRWAEDGPIPPPYPLHETPSADPAQRTRWNVRDADATLILHRGPLQGGTARTAAVAHRCRKPLHMEDVRSADVRRICRWIAARRVRVLNVAGPRESESHGIARQAFGLVSAMLLRMLTAPADPVLRAPPHTISEAFAADRGRFEAPPRVGRTLGRHQRPAAVKLVGRLDELLEQPARGGVVVDQHLGVPLYTY